MSSNGSEAADEPAANTIIDPEPPDPNSLFLGQPRQSNTDKSIVLKDIEEIVLGVWEEEGLEGNALWESFQESISRSQIQQLSARENGFFETI